MIIGITTTFVVEEQKDERVPVERVTAEYVRRVAATGAVPVLLPPIDGTDEDNERIARELIERIDGLVLAGGGDIAPTRYGDHEQLPETTYVFDTRDALELELARLAHKFDVPTLGICRGMQVMNVALGGTLHQDVHACGLTTAKHQQKPPYDVTQQNVRLAVDSALGRALQADPQVKGPQRTITVNSMHHQAVSEVAPSLRVSAVSDDGLIEGLEDPTRTFFLGVQWHPEYLDDNAPLFQALADAAR
ncbi:peptidase C26 [Paraeggerthella hongkongensis]|uniref:gamma-glutamyl-gamma-aminobutyrate hydrolase family protein n=1 Tax=Paraeggerthella sp. TaxID=2897350 RepID=UPI000DF79F68|nr:peptidase C26 [Paraeggerthella hongkongensis]